MLGRVAGLYGVRGWIKVFSYTEPRDAILEYRRWCLSTGGHWRQHTVREGRRQGKSIVASIEGIDDRDAAAELVGGDIAVDREDLPAPGDSRWYWADLEGMTVVHRDGTALGRVAYLLETGANDVLVTTGDRERLIPFVAEEVILDVDLDKRVITVDWEWD